MISITTNDAANQNLAFVIVPANVWVVKDSNGNELGNVSEKEQVQILQATFEGSPDMAKHFLGVIPSLEEQIAYYKSVIQSVINYTNSTSFIGSFEGVQSIAEQGLNKYP